MPKITHTIDILLAHDKWATEQLFSACKSLDDAALDRVFEIGPGSLRKLIVHLIDVVSGWYAGVSTKPFTAAPADADIAVLTTLHEKAHAAFTAFVQSTSPDDTITAIRGERKLTGPRDGFVVHVMTHQTHHRAQALNMLRHLNVKPLPQSSVMQWMLATGIGQMQIVSASPAPSASSVPPR